MEPIPSYPKSVSLLGSVTLLTAPLLGLLVGLLLGTSIGTRDKLAYEGFPILRTDKDAVADALLAERLRRLQDETGMSSGPDIAKQTVPSNNREELLALTYRSKLSGLSPEQRRAKELSLLTEEIAREQKLYGTLSGRTDSKATGTSQLTWGVGGALAGFVFGLTGLFLIECKSRRSITTDKVLRRQSFLRLGIVPNFQSLSMWSSLWKQAEGKEKISELYRGIASKLLIADWGKNRRTYIVISPHAKDGRTTVVGNLRIAFGESGLRVALLASDLTSPALREFFSLANDFGFREVDSDSTSSERASATVTIATEFEYVSVIQTRRSPTDTNPRETLERIGTLIHRLRNEFDLILVDSGPALDSDFPFELSGSCDGVILVFQNRTTNVTEMKTLLARTGGQLSGVVLNN